MGWLSKNIFNPFVKGAKTVGNVFKKGYKVGSRAVHKVAKGLDKAGKVVESIGAGIKKVPIVGALATPVVDAVTGIVGKGRSYIGAAGNLERDLKKLAGTESRKARKALGGGSSEKAGVVLSDYAKRFSKKLKGKTPKQMRDIIQTELRRVGRTEGVVEVRRRASELRKLLKK